MIESALDDGHIIRTHLLRPTWHFVSSNDIYWMIKLTRDQIKSAMKPNDRNLELTEEIFSRSNAILERSLRDNNQLTREEIAFRLKKADILTSENRLSHLLMRAEICGIVCNGKRSGIKQTYALLPERVTKMERLPRDLALAKLADRYFRSHVSYGHFIQQPIEIIEKPSW